MKGFIIKYKGKEIKVGLNEGVSNILLFEQNGNSQSYIGAFDSSNNENHIWHNHIALDNNDKIEIELAEFEQSSPSNEILKMEPPSASKTKLEMFLELEKSLKESRLL